MPRPTTVAARHHTTLRLGDASIRQLEELGGQRSEGFEVAMRKMEGTR